MRTFDFLATLIRVVKWYAILPANEVPYPEYEWVLKKIKAFIKDARLKGFLDPMQISALNKLIETELE